MREYIRHTIPMVIDVIAPTREIAENYLEEVLQSAFKQGLGEAELYYQENPDRTKEARAVRISDYDFMLSEEHDGRSD